MISNKNQTIRSPIISASIFLDTRRTGAQLKEIEKPTLWLGWRTALQVKCFRIDRWLSSRVEGILHLQTDTAAGLLILSEAAHELL